MPQLLSAQEDFRKSAPEPTKAPEIKLGDFQDFKLENGLTVILVENHKLPRVSYQLYVDVPLRAEGEYAGLSNIVGDMLGRSTTKRTKAEIDDSVDFIGASLRTSGSGGYGATISRHKETLLATMAEVLLMPKFPAEEMDKVKQLTLSGLASSENDPGAIAGRVTNAVLYGLDYPYGEVTTPATVEKLTPELVQQYYNEYFVPNRSYLVMVGDLKGEEAKQMAQKYFGAWKAKPVVETKIARPVAPEGTMVHFVPRAGSVQSNIIVARPINLQPGSKEAIRSRILNQIFGSGFSGRLFQNLREDKGYTYGSYSSFDDDPYVGSFQATAEVRNEVTDSSITEILYEMDKISSEKVSDKELLFGKTQLMGSFARAMESPQTIAQYALNTARYKLDKDFYATYLKRAEASSANDLLEVAKEYITPKRMHIVVVGDKAVAESLMPFATDGKIHYYDVYGNPIEMSTAAIPADLTPEKVINKYIKAIGGKEKLMAVKDLSITSSASMQGQPITMKLDRKGNKMLNQSVSMMGNTMFSMSYNDGKMKAVQMGQAVPLPDEAAAGLAIQALHFPEMAYLERGKMTLDGQETIDGQNAYGVKIDMGGQEITEYYAAESGLKLRTVLSEMGQAATYEYADYQAVDGIMFPMTIKSDQPMPMTAKTTEIKVNKGIDDTVFSVE